MSETRDNHFVPQWYQRGFFEPGRSTLAYLDMQPEMHMRGDGTPVPGRNVFSSTTTQCFRQYDLYTTFFGFAISDEIERRLFGGIDRKGTPAVAAFAGDDVEARMRHFVDFFEFMDAQKLRTPKGLAWLRRHYPFLDQNQLMFEMQGVRRLHCSLWAQCVREIVSADESGVKFLISDHPVTVYNHAVPPDDPACAYPNDPSIAWKGSQTIYPLNRDYCLILTNLEYAKDPDLADPRRKRTNAKNFGDGLVRSDIMIRTRKLDAHDVVRINHVLKARATRHVAAGSRDWLYPEQVVDTDWAGLRETLLPPKDELWNWGGETYIGFADGSTAYQDAHGRSEPGSERLLKSEADHPRTPKDACGCGSGKRFGLCCATRPAELRPSWSERSIRERNLVLIAAVADITGLGAGMDWTEARRGLTSDKIAEIYTVFRALWPPETDIFALLPKPDGRLRGLFTGMVDPRMLVEFAVGAANYFGEVLIQNPFPFAGGMKPEFDPTKVPGEYRFEVLKHILMLLELAPLIETGAVNFFPDPCNFDRHLRQQMMQMAEARAGGDFDEADIDPRTKWIHVDDRFRHLWSGTEAGMRAQILRADPDATEEMIGHMIAMVRDGRVHDPFAALTDNITAEGMPEPFACIYDMVPNFELTLLIAQATGSVIVTDSPYRWREILQHAGHMPGGPAHALPALRAAIEGADHMFLYEVQAIASILRSPAGGGYRSLIHDAMRYVSGLRQTGPKPNWESQLPGRFGRAHAALQAALRKTGALGHVAKAKCIIPTSGIRDNMVNRLIVTSSVEHYLEHVPMAFFLERPDPSTYSRLFPSKPWATEPEPELF